MDFGLFGAGKRGFNCNAQIANVVKGVEDTEDANAVCRGVLNEFFYHVVGIVIIAEQVLSAQEHLNRRVLEVGFKIVEAFPRVFVQKP